jgi:hypothetical protein
MKEEGRLGGGERACGQNFSRKADGWGKGNGLEKDEIMHFVGKQYGIGIAVFYENPIGAFNVWQSFFFVLNEWT